jgi:AraC family transcriptional regulator of adaptative response/methylated-DNA-[protein]-cysteine methyltransferase
MKNNAGTPKVIFKTVSASELKNSVGKITYGIYHSPFGWCVIGVVNGNICQISFLKTNSDSEALKELHRIWPAAQLAKNNTATKKYFDTIFGNKSLGKPMTVIMKGTDFQLKVWKGLLNIPKGKTITYAKLATFIKNPKAVRAVGSACGKNPILFLVPCHRVLASNGGLGGYSSGGLPRKMAMLAGENFLAK